MYNTKEIVLNVFNTFANEEKAYYLERIVYKNLDNITLKKDVSNVWITMIKEQQCRYYGNGD
jgi:hypothetical protein